MHPRPFPRSRSFSGVWLGLIVGLVVAMILPIGLANPGPLPSAPPRSGTLSVPGDPHALAPPAVTPLAPAAGISSSSAGSVLRTYFPNYNGTLNNNFPWSVSGWQIGTPAFVPSTGELWLPNRAVSIHGLPAPGIAPAIIYNASSNQFMGFDLAVENSSAFAFDPSNGDLYSADVNNDTVGVLDATTGSWVHPAIPVGVAPSALALDLASGLLYVANSGSNNVTIIDTSIQAVGLPGIAVGRSPIDLALDLRDHTLFIADSGDSFLGTIDILTNSTGPSASLQGPAGGVAVSAVANMVGVTVPASTQLAILNATSLATKWLPVVGLGAQPIFTNQSGPAFVVGNSSGSNLMIVDSSTGVIEASQVIVGSGVSELASGPSSSSVIAWGSVTRNLTLVSLASFRSIAHSTTLSPQPWDTTFDPGTGRLFLADTFGESIVELNLATGYTANQSIVPTNGVSSVAVDSGLSTLYVGESNVVQSYGVQTSAVQHSSALIPGRNGPLLVDSADGTLWVVNSVSGIHVLSLSTLAPVFNVPIQPTPGTEDSLALVPHLHEVFVVNESAGIVEAVNSSDGIIEDSSISAGSSPSSIAFDSGDNELYVAGSNLTIVDPSTYAIVVPSIPLVAHSTLSGITYDPSREYLYLTSYLGGPTYASTVSVIDGSSIVASEGSQATMPAGELAVAPTPVALGGSGPAGDSMIVVANAQSGTLSVIASPPVINAFTSSPSSIDENLTTQFIVDVSGGTGPLSTSYSGLPPGCASQDLLTLSCAPNQSGIFTVVATVTDALGYQASALTTLTVASGLSVHATFIPGPNAVLDVGSVLTGHAGAIGGTPPYSFAWNFGDGGTASGANVNYSFPSPGMYAVTVTVTDSLGESSGRSTAVTVNPDPVATISTLPAAETDPNVPMQLIAGISGGTGPGNDSWSFGDGTNGTGPIVSHSWTAAGTYTVHLHYVDVLGVSANATITVIVNPPLHATFSANSPGSVTTVGTQIDFVANITGGTVPYNVTWSFADGSIAYGMSVTHGYGSAGSYGVVVAVVDAAGARWNATLPIQISPGSSSTLPGVGIGSTPDGELFLGVIVGAAIGAVLLYLADRSRRRAPPPPSPYVPPDTSTGEH